MRRLSRFGFWLGLAVILGCEGIEVIVIGVDPDVPLPPLPAMSNVTVVPGDHRVTVSFDPVDGARDYRLYAIPDPDDVVLDAEGRLEAIENGTYRCAGTHDAPPIGRDAMLDPLYNNCEAAAVVDSRAPYTAHCGSDAWCYPTAGGSGNYFGEGGYPRVPEEAQLGFVYTSPGEGRAPVRAFGDPDGEAYVACSWHNWTATRNKRYTSDPTEWETLRAEGWLDYGEVFFVPSSDASAVHTLYETSLPSTSVTSERHYYYAEGGDEHAFRIAAGQPMRAVFAVLDEAPPPDLFGATAALPLFRVLYSLGFGNHQHDELAVGRARFDDAYGLGIGQSNLRITFTWSGEAPSRLVLEALDAGCPFRGEIADHEVAASADRPGWSTLETIRARSPHREVFLNGQHDPETLTPRPIARAILDVPTLGPTPLEVTLGAGDATEVFLETSPTCTDENFQCDAGSLHTFESARFDATFNGIEDDGRYALFTEQGELRSLLTDRGASVTGQLRISGRDTVDMNADRFVHAVLEVTATSTATRYPQIIVDDRPDLPLWLMHTDTGVGSGRTILVSPAENWPGEIRVELCTNTPWSPLTPCPSFWLASLPDGRRAPVDAFRDRVRVDVPTRLEVYASSTRIYVLVDGAPYGCASYDAALAPNGESRVTFGDVIHHSSADYEILTILAGGFVERHSALVSERHYGEVGYSGDVDAPAWDHARIPCATALE